MTDPIKLETLKHAGIVPRVPRWWSIACWTLFFAGIATVLWGLKRIGANPTEAADPKAVMRWLLPALIVVAALNTFVAATRFVVRRDQLCRWIRERLEEWSGDVHGQAGPYDEADERGHLVLTVHKAETSWRIRASGAFRPDAYRTEGTSHATTFDYGKYLELIQAETHAARTHAAKLAAALGGLFVLMFQVYVRLPL